MFDPARGVGTFAVVLAVCSACDGETAVRLVDPPIDLSEAPALGTEDGAVEVVLGSAFEGGLFAPWHDGSECPVFIGGAQVDPSIMPAIHAVGLEAPVTARVVLILAGAQVALADVTKEIPFEEFSDGWLGVEAFAVPLDISAQAATELYGLPALVYVWLGDDRGRQAERWVDVVLVAGEP